MTYDDIRFLTNRLRCRSYTLEDVNGNGVDEQISNIFEGREDISKVSLIQLPLDNPIRDLSLLISKNEKEVYESTETIINDIILQYTEDLDSNYVFEIVKEIYQIINDDECKINIDAVDNAVNYLYRKVFRYVDKAEIVAFLGWSNHSKTLNFLVN